MYKTIGDNFHLMYIYIWCVGHRVLSVLHPIQWQPEGRVKVRRAEPELKSCWHDKCSFGQQVQLFIYQVLKTTQSFTRVTRAQKENKSHCGGKLCWVRLCIHLWTGSFPRRSTLRHRHLSLATFLALLWMNTHYSWYLGLQWTDFYPQRIWRHSFTIQLHYLRWRLDGRAGTDGYVRAEAQPSRISRPWQDHKYT